VQTPTRAVTSAQAACIRRQTCTINYCADLPLARGVRFEVDA
jgi:hypothetical protein